MGHRFACVSFLFFVSFSLVVCYVPNWTGISSLLFFFLFVAFFLLPLYLFKLHGSWLHGCMVSRATDSTHKKTTKGCLMHGMVWYDKTEEGEGGGVQEGVRKGKEVMWRRGIKKKKVLWQPTFFFGLIFYFLLLPFTSFVPSSGADQICTMKVCERWRYAAYCDFVIASLRFFADPFFFDLNLIEKKEGDDLQGVSTWVQGFFVSL